MAKQKKETVKFFECKTCSEKFLFRKREYCLLKCKDSNNPSDSALCENVEICNWYHKKLSFD